MKHILPIVTALLSAGICLSDMGPIPIKETEIREPVQNAIILFDQDQKKETIILQTQLVSTRAAKGMFFMPLPSNPEVSTAEPDVFSRVVGFAKECGVTFILADATGDLNGPGGGPEPKVRGISVVFTKNIAEHDITVIRVESWENLRQWIVQYVIDKRLPVDFDLQKIEKTVQAYTKDEIRYFLFDVVGLTDQAISTKPLVIDFDSDKLYYPLRVNALYDGPSDVQLLVFSPSRIPKGRFEKIGFLESEQYEVLPIQAKYLWSGLSKRLPGQLSFLCCYMPDPRNAYQEFHTKAEYRRHFTLLAKCALERWARDVNLSMVWGKSHDPDYYVSPEWSMSNTFLDGFLRQR